jgi:hypothetical protein
MAIILLLAYMALAAFGQFRAKKTMDAAVEVTLAAFSQAHLDTLSSKNSQQYGVHLDTDKVVYYLGPTYVAGAATNISYVLHPVLEIANITLTGGGTDVLFNRLTGGTSQAGTFEVRQKGSTTVKTIITVNGTGAVSL